MDARWQIFAKLCKEEFSECEFQDQLVSACVGNEDIACAAYFHLRGDALNWLERRVPNLSERTPASLLAEGKGDEVRDCFWSMPS